MPHSERTKIRLEWIPVERISYHFFQARKHADREGLLHLMLAIDRVGLLHPILVRPRGAAYELISGYRRLQACKRLGWTEVPAVVQEMSDEEALQAAIFANTAASDLQLMERCEAISYARKVMADEPPQEIAQWFGVDDEFLAVARKLVSLPAVLRESILAGVLHPTQAIELSRIEDPTLLAAAAGKAARDQLTPAETSVFVDEVIKTKRVPGLEEESPEGGTAVLVERLYQRLHATSEFDADALRMALRAVLSAVDGPPEEFLDFSYDPAMSFYLPQHVSHVARLAVLIGRTQGLGGSEVAMLAVCALLHDVGMMRVPRAILDKKEALTVDEIESIRAHADTGSTLLERCGLREDAVLAVVREHHERPDGSGYPRGLRGDEIHPYARIIAVADTYEALVSPRPHRLPVRPPLAMREVLDLAVQGRLDAEVVRHLVRAVGHFPPGSRVRLSNGETGVVTRVNPTHPDRPVVRLLGPEGSEPEGVRTEFDLLASPQVEIVG